MNTTASDAVDLLNALKPFLEDVEGVDVAVCPPFPYLSLISKTLEGSRILLGAQNMHHEAKGAYTGEVSPAMLKDVGCDLVILGHSERRHIFGETDETIRKKIQSALEFGLRPILCIGETLDDREADKTADVVRRQLKGCLEGFSRQDMEHIILAYEPVWAIGTGRTATPEQAEEVHRLTREWIEEQFDKKAAGSIRIQYGGSVKPGNARQLLEQPDIDGALVGGASLDAESFAAIVQAAIA